MDMMFEIIGGVVLLMILGAWLGRRTLRDRMTHCDTREAEVLTVEQNFVSKSTLNLTLQMRLTDQPGAPRLASLTESVKLAEAPRPGDRIMVWVDRRAPEKVYYRGLAANFLNAQLIQQGKGV